MTPSIELRNMAAELHEKLSRAEDWHRELVDRLPGDIAVIWAESKAEMRREQYVAFCRDHGFMLKTDASGLFLRCAETGIPLVIGDEYDELETGECVLVKRAA